MAGSSRRKLAMQPGLGHGPLALYRGSGYPDRLGSFLHREAPEESQFDDLGLAGVQLLQARQRLVDTDQVGGAIFSHYQRLIERGLVHIAAALDALPGL